MITFVTPDAAKSSTRRKAYSYLRFSTAEQSKGDSKRRQIDLAVAYATEHALDLDLALTYHDLGVSAFHSKNALTGRLSDFQVAVQSGLIDPGSFLLVESLDRISRDHAIYALDLLTRIVLAGVTIVTLLDRQVYSIARLEADPMGLMYALVGFIRANEESETKSRRGRYVWEAKRQRALSSVYTRAGPAWLRYDEKEQGFVVIPERAKLIQRMFRLTLQGLGHKQLAIIFNAEKIPPWGRSIYWHPTYIAKIILSTATIGVLTPHTAFYEDGLRRRRALAPIEGYYPQVISLSTFQKTTALREAAGAARRGKNTKYPLRNAYATLAVCPLCSGTMVRTMNSRNKDVFLVCGRGRVSAGCLPKRVAYAPLQECLWKKLPDQLRQHVSGATNTDVNALISAGELALADAREKAGYLADLLISERSATLVGRLLEMEDYIDRLREDTEKLRASRDKAMGPLVRFQIDQLLAELEVSEYSHLDVPGVNGALRRVFQRAVINWPDGTIDLQLMGAGYIKLAFGAPQLVDRALPRSFRRATALALRDTAAKRAQRTDIVLDC